jgi:ferredoxin
VSRTVDLFDPHTGTFSSVERPDVGEKVHEDLSLIRRFLRILPSDYDTSDVEAAAERLAALARRARVEPSKPEPVSRPCEQCQGVGGCKPDCTKTAVRFPIPAGTRPSTCRGCDRTVFWIVTEAGRKMPVDPDGISHFATCPEAASFRRRPR